jgi:exodeoxyribonuclease V beta subunit
MRDFDVKHAPISGVNLVEASAGTGKTYSVGVLVLRCLLEQKLPIGKILMVTFTKAAVAELEDRVRKFVRLAYGLAFGKTPIDSSNPIHIIVQRSLKADSSKSKKILVRALSHLDELSVMTIHSFCEKNLKEFAFSSGQMFQQEILADENELITKFAQEYWQNLLCGPDKDIVLASSKISFSDFTGRIECFLKGDVLQAKESVENPFKDFEELLKNSPEDLIAYTSGVNNFKNAGVNVSNATEFLEFAKSKITTKYIQGIPSPYLDLIISCKRFEDEAPSYIYKKGLEEIAEKLHRHKETRALMSYNDLIDKMHTAVVDPNYGEAFANNVAKNYWAVFIDEFQDTDAKQHKIFKTIFAERARVLYYIGDPKQSIYGWRSADLDVYDTAKSEVKQDHQFTMKTNFRSETAYIDGLNALYGALGQSDFKRDGLRYIPVAANNQANIFRHHESEGKLNYCEVDKADVHKHLANKIKEVLFSAEYAIDNKSIIASDIGVLVRRGKDGKIIKSYLETYGIPSILRDGNSVFRSEEARLLLAILRAIESVNQKNIGSALVGSFFGITSTDWYQRNIETDLVFFKEMQLGFSDKGVLNVISRVLQRYNFYAHTQSLGAGDRMQSNVQQLSELLYKQQNFGGGQLSDLVQYLENERQSSDSASDDEKEKRIESDENAVQITTIHKAKGLQYNIVFALTDFDKSSSRRSFFSYKNLENAVKEERATKSEGGKLVLSSKDLERYDAAQQWHETQNHEENCRMIYVLLTRAVYASYLFGNSKDKGSFSDSRNAIIAISGNNGVQAHFDVRSEYPTRTEPHEETPIAHGIRDTKNLRSFSSTFNTQSYSSLSGHAYKPQEKEDHIESELSEYDTYVFKTLPRGAQPGTFMHELFENTNFIDAPSWQKTADTLCKRYGGQFEKEEIKIGLPHLIENTLGCYLGSNISLNTVANNDKLNEMEFFLTTKDWDVLNNEIVKKHFGERLSLNYDKVPDGFLNGFIDLIFEQNGRYHVLDWKSNHLGNNVASYTADKLDEAMTNSNYHLQYLIYSIALYRYLKQVLDSQFDYDNHMGNVYYLFFRGLRSGQSTGVFTTKIPLEVLQQFD